MRHIATIQLLALETCLLSVLAACATPTPPATCTELTGVGVVPVIDAQGRTVTRYTYADDAMRVRHLQCRAELGERRAGVELARAYEIGDGLPRDERRAAELYESAAQDRPAVTSIYSPAVRIGGSGHMMMLPNPGGGLGDPEAKYRLGRMLVDGRGVARDMSRGQALIETAMQRGFRDDGRQPVR